MQTIPSIEDFLSRSASELANTQIACPWCNKIHQIPIQSIYNQSGVIHQLDKIIQHTANGSSRPTLIYDGIIQEFIDEQIITPLQVQKIIPFILPVLSKDGKRLHATDKVGDEIVRGVNPDTDLIIGAGSGVISDLTKWAATKLDIPFILISTAASMNGHASITAAMTFDDIKETAHGLRPASAVIFDTDIFAKAPFGMTLSGLTDIMARNTCNADWKLSNLLLGTDFCPLPFMMMVKPHKQLLDLAGGISKKEPDSMLALGEATLTSALTMTILNGLTSPSSGAEHVMSHYWDLLSDMQGLEHNLHGTQVGIGVMIALSLYETIRKVDPTSISIDKLLRQRPSLETLEADHRKMYAPIVAKHFNKVARDKYLPDEAYRDYLKHIIESWEDIWDAVDPYTITLDRIRQPMLKAGAPLKIVELGFKKEQALEALLYGRFYRPRFTILISPGISGFWHSLGSLLFNAGVL